MVVLGVLSFMLVLIESCTGKKTDELIFSCLGCDGPGCCGDREEGSGGDDDQTVMVVGTPVGDVVTVEGSAF